MTDEFTRVTLMHKLPTHASDLLNPISFSRLSCQFHVVSWLAKSGWMQNHSSAEVKSRSLPLTVLHEIDRLASLREGMK